MADLTTDYREGLTTIPNRSLGGADAMLSFLSRPQVKKNHTQAPRAIRKESKREVARKTTEEAIWRGILERKFLSQHI